MRGRIRYWPGLHLLMSTDDHWSVGVIGHVHSLWSRRVGMGNASLKRRAGDYVQAIIAALDMAVWQLAMVTSYLEERRICGVLM